jgi:predicted Zn-dependent protease with MMP-like domain
MISLEEMEVMLDEIAVGFPQELYKELNGGIVLLPEVKLNKIGRNNDLYILGEYHKGGGLGRYITIYYGSFSRLYGRLEKENLRERLTHVLKHEFTHHLESLAGERGLEIEDAQYISDYLNHKDK